jgi:ketosteroid isomerase-like protein
MLAEAYNNSNADGINYYAEDAVSFSNGKMPLEGKAIHESIKNELIRKAQNRLRNSKSMLQMMEIW